MFKLKLVAGFIALATSLTVMAAPAVAEFQSNTGQSQGPIKTFPELSTFQGVSGGQKVECKAKNAAGEVVAKGGWIIQGKAFTQQGKYFYQTPALNGPHEQFKFEKWGICTGPTGIAATVECSLQVENAGQNGNTGSVQAPGCSVKIGSGENTCTINVAQDGNKELSKVKLANEGANGVAINSEVEGITSTHQETKELCKTLGIATGQGTGKFITKEPLITEGQKLA